MDSLELSAALDAARAGEKYWKDLAAINAEQIAALREERDVLEANRKLLVADNFHLTAEVERLTAKLEGNA